MSTGGIAANIPPITDFSIDCLSIPRHLTSPDQPSIVASFLSRQRLLENHAVGRCMEPRSHRKTLQRVEPPGEASIDKPGLILICSPVSWSSFPNGFRGFRSTCCRMRCNSRGFLVGGPGRWTRTWHAESLTLPPLHDAPRRLQRAMPISGPRKSGRPVSSQCWPGGGSESSISFSLRSFICRMVT